MEVLEAPLGVLEGAEEAEEGQVQRGQMAETGLVVLEEGQVGQQQMLL